MSIEYTDNFFPNSTLIEYVAYNSNNGQMFVALKGRSGVHRYDAVPQSVYLDFVSAESAGRFWNKHFRGNRSAYVGTNVPFIPVAPPQAAAATPKALTPSTSNVAGNNYVSLKQSSDNRKHTIAFSHDDATRTYSVNASSVEEALAALDEVSDMLDLNFDVKSVTVHFE